MNQHVGREFQALFLGTIEPTDYDGMTCNPTKSICDPFVFNTAITRARSLVVCIGNPFTLLRMERNSSKSCWKEYLHLCSMNNTLIIKECTNNHVEIQKLQTLIEGKTLPSTAIKMVSYPNERNASKCQKTELGKLIYPVTSYAILLLTFTAISYRNLHIYAYL